MHITKKVWGILLVTLYAIQLSAQQTGLELQYSLVVWFHDGEKVSFPLAEHPVVTCSDGNIMVSTTDGSAKYAYTLVRKFTIEKVKELPEAASELYFVVWMHGGARISFPFAEHPRLTYSDGDIVVATSQEQLSYPHASVCKFTLTNENISQDETAEIAFTERDDQWHRQGDMMMFFGCTPGESVVIYDAKGHLLQRHTIASDGSLQIPLHPFAGGVHIVKTESITYKFVKK